MWGSISSIQNIVSSFFYFVSPCVRNIHLCNWKQQVSCWSYLDVFCGTQDASIMLGMSFFFFFSLFWNAGASSMMIHADPCECELEIDGELVMKMTGIFCSLVYFCFHWVFFCAETVKSQFMCHVYLLGLYCWNSSFFNWSHLASSCMYVNYWREDKMCLAILGICQHMLKASFMFWIRPQKTVQYTRCFKYWKHVLS